MLAIGVVGIARDIEMAEMLTVVEPCVKKSERQGYGGKHAYQSRDNTKKKILTE